MVHTKKNSNLSFINYVIKSFQFQKSRFAVLIILFQVVLTFFFPSILSGQQNKYHVKKVVIDAGHGGKDPGAMKSKIKEKDIVLAVALKLGDYIKKNIKDVEVIYTRSTDVFIELDRRAEIANSNHADVFISVHANSNKNKKLMGVETYVMGLDKKSENLDLAVRENSVILSENDYTTRYEGYNPNAPESYIIFSLMQNINLEQSLVLASKVQNQMKLKGKRISRAVKQAGLVVLWKTTMPGILVEIGYMTNQKELDFITSDTGQDMLASCIYRAFRDYKHTIESHTETTKKPTKNEMVYKVQIKLSNKQIPLNSSVFKGVQNIEEFEADGFYRYMVGEAKTLQDAMTLQKKMKEKFPNAFAIGIKNGKLVPIKQNDKK